MYRFFGEQDAYSLFNTVSVYATILICLLFVKYKTNELGLFSQHAVLYASRKSTLLGTILKYILSFVEIALLTAVSLIMVNFNYPFGDLVGTGANYFGGLFACFVLELVCSLVIMANPLKHLDIATLLLPMRLFFLKVACYLNGCCWGIPWKYGPYNNHYHHPGNQVPVQAIEAGFAIAILIFLLIYRKKSKPGTLFPMYMILYGATRFFVEFFSAAHEKILGPFNTYHFLCIISVIVGTILLIIIHFFGEKMMDFFDKPRKKLEERELKIKLAKQAAIEADRLERAEKAKLAREKAKARRGK